MRMRAVVEMNNVWCSGGSGQPLRGLSLTVEAGEIAALVGPPGSGKTTVLEVILGWRRPRSGTVRICGENPVTTGRMIRYLMGAVLDPPGLYPATGCGGGRSYPESKYSTGLPETDREVPISDAEFGGPSAVPDR